MEKELDINVIKATQSSLGKYVKRPPLSDKLLKKPPFRFLHDIVTTIIKTTGFFEGLFDEKELISENVKDRESKILFLNKVVTVVATTTGKTLTVKPSKIVAGQEPEKTNELLQCLALALDKKLSSADAVKKLNEKDKVTPKESDERKTKDDKDTLKKSDKNEKKNNARNTDKLVKPKRDEHSLTRVEKDRNKNTKSNIGKQEVKQNSNDTKKQVVAKKQPSNQQNSIDKQVTSVTNKTPRNNVEIHNQNQKVNHVQETEVNINQIPLALDSGVISNVNQPVDNSLAKNFEESLLNPSVPTEETNLSIEQPTIIQAESDLNKELQETSNTDNEPSIQGNHNLIDLNIHSDVNNIQNEVTIKQDANKETESVIKRSLLRPPTVRPPSSRPGAPRLKEKNDETYNGTDNLLVGKVNIIVENTPNDEDEDTSLIVIDNSSKTVSSGNEKDSLQSISNQHGHLVQQILDSQKEFSQVTSGKTEIEWEFDSQRIKEASTQELEQMRFNIEAVSRISNPLGKLLDHIQEDVEVMRQELQQWTANYQQASKEFAKQKSANEESLLPLLSKKKQLDMDIQDKREKINDLKIIIHKNSWRINNLLASGDVQ